MFGRDTRNYLLLNKRVLSYGLKIYFGDPPTSKIKVNPVIEKRKTTSRWLFESRN